MSFVRNVDRYADFPWDQTPLGPVHTWPAAMQATVRTVLACGMPMASAWGPDRIQIYNDGYNAIYGDKHPAAFGTAAAPTWGEIWTFLEPAIASIFDTGATLNFQGMMLPLRKRDRPQECYFDFSYSSVFDESGRVLGFLSVATETTAEVLGRRRQTVFDTLDKAWPAHADLAALWHALREALSGNAQDAAAAALYPFDAVGAQLLPPVWELRESQSQEPAWRQAIHALPLSRRLRQHPRHVSVGHDAAASVCLLPIHSRDGAPLAVLALQPGPLVPVQGSHAPFAQALSERLHAMLHERQAHEAQRTLLSRELHEKDQFYRFLFDNIHDGALYAVTDGKVGSSEVVLAANRQACALLGYAEADIVGLTRDQLVLHDAGALDLAVRQREQSKLFVGELLMRHRDGHAVPVGVSSRLVDAPGGGLRSVTLVRDATARREQERRQLDAARAETLSRLSAGIAHDFNNLLTVIACGVDLLSERLAPGSPQATVIGAMQQATDKAAAMTRELLTFTTTQRFRTRRVDLAALVVEVEQMLRGSVGDAVHLTLALDRNTPPCELDVTMFTSALLNLSINARDAMPDGGELRISTDVVDAADLTLPSTLPAGTNSLWSLAPDETARNQPAEGGTPGTGPSPLRYVRLSVSDTGLGMTQEVLDRLFEPFFTTKPPGRGTGLGLPMVQGFVRQSGGMIHVTSAPGQETRFDLYFPVSKDAEHAADAAVRLPGARGQGELVLVVEDNELVREQAVRMLADAGFSCVSTSDGPAALSLFNAEGAAFDAVFSDVMMPGGMSGRQLADQIRSHDPDMPILLTSGYEAQDSAPAGAAPRYEVLPKPYSRDALVDALLRQLAGRQPPMSLLT